MVLGIDAQGVVTGVLGLLLLATVRMFSERPLRGRQRTGRSRKGWFMFRTGRYRSNRELKDKSRSFLEYVLETMWACGAGVMAAHWPPSASELRPAPCHDRLTLSLHQHRPEATD